VTPVFIGTVALTPRESLRWQPGQKTTVSFCSATETHARLLWRWATQWMTRRIEYARSN
jgi:hypothetical protein